MEKTEILAKVTEVFREIFAQPDLVISAETTADDIETWDSFTHINLIMLIEERLSVTFALGELKDLKNVGALLTLIESKLQNSSAITA